MSDRVRVVSWNVESLLPWLEEPAELRARVDALDADVLCLQEIRVRPEDDALVARLDGLLPGYACAASLCRDRRNVRHRRRR
ncbi:MAG TPA: endonuclease/exonuclease/phosphatase family protein [Byssovorax sp.]